MTQFRTRIPIVLDQVKAALPPSSLVEGVEYDGNEIILTWSNHKVIAPYHTMEFGLDLLEQGKLPQGCRKSDPSPVAEIPVPPVINVDKKGRRAQKKPVT